MNDATDTTDAICNEFPGFRTVGGPVWAGAAGDRMIDTDGRRVLDLATGFGVYLHGHGLPLPDLKRGMISVAPGLGDLFATELRDSTCALLCEHAAHDWDGCSSEDLRALVLQSGSEAVETAIKTALLATGRSTIVAFDGSYHGTFGLALAVTHRPAFREPFANQYGHSVRFSPYGEVPELDESVACVVVEPIQGRAGIIVPPDSFLGDLREACTKVGALLIIDAVLVGAGRTGVFAAGAACNPDLLCLGKALGAGVPASAVIARAAVAEAAWGKHDGEPVHTATNLGHPLSCAAITRSIESLLVRAPLEDRSRQWESTLGTLLPDAQGSGLAWAFDTRRPGGGIAMAQTLLHEHSILVVPSGDAGQSITLLPSVLTNGPTTTGAVESIVAAARQLLS